MNRNFFLKSKKIEVLKEMFAQMIKFQMESQQKKIRKNSFNFRKKTKKESLKTRKNNNFRKKTKKES